MGFYDFGRLQRRDGVAGGQVCFSGTGVLVEFVAGCFMAGDSLSFLAEQYALPAQTIEAGVRLVLFANGVSLTSKRAEAKISKRIPLLK